jgi:hypothetical protein
LGGLIIMLKMKLEKYKNVLESLTSHNSQKWKSLKFFHFCVPI